jgi:hypothetical protein
MASVSASLRTKLLTYNGISSIVGQRMYADVLPKSATMPAVILWRISTTRDHTVSDVTKSGHTRIQVDCYANTRAAADSLALAIQQSGICAFRGTVDSITISGVEIDSGDQHEHEPPTDGNQVHRYLTSFDFMVHYSEA